MDPDAYATTVARMAADATTIIMSGDVVHLVHGGHVDDDTVWNYACHLQSSWRAGLVWINCMNHLERFVQVMQHAAMLRNIPSFIVVVPIELFARAPALYDALQRMLDAMLSMTLFVSVPACSIAKDARPYGTLSRTVVILCSSIYVETASIAAHAARIYACPKDTADCARFCAVLQHNEGIAWRLDATTAEPSFITATARAMPHAVQDATDKLFWWSTGACRPTFWRLADMDDDVLINDDDSLDFVLILPANCPFNATRARVHSWSHCIVNTAPSWLDLVLPAAREPLHAARIASMCPATWDCHLVTFDGRYVLPMRLYLETATFVRMGIVRCKVQSNRHAADSGIISPLVIHRTVPASRTTTMSPVHIQPLDTK